MDFYCVAVRLVLELEGDAHDSIAQEAYDAARAELLEAAGYRVVRIRNCEVTREHLETILRDALRRPPIVPPSPEGRGGQGVRTHGEEATGLELMEKQTRGEDS